jgi:ABC-type transport system involved in multi-copper enzyme maturation permease subunit
MAAVVRLELLAHRREPLIALYMLVFVLLGAAFTASGPVDLVRDRGAVPRDAAWSIMLASTALTAFGQVITTMVAATIVLRDRADRVADLIAVTRLTAREYFVAKLAAALLILCLIYCAVPVGLLLGAVLGGGSAATAVGAIAPPFTLVVLPTMLSVGALQFSAGVLSGRLWVLVGLGLVLIWIWSAAAGAAGHAGSGWLAVLSDPFGSAPLLQATREWSDAERTSRAMPITAGLLANRAIWLGLGAAVASVALRVGSRQAAHTGVVSTRGTAIAVPPPLAVTILRGAPATAMQGAIATARYVMRWMLRDAGWRVLAALGAVNVGVHVFLDVQGSATSEESTRRTLAALTLHSQLFLILLATIYAGELVWREREQRSDALFDVQPVGDAALIGGRLAGAMTAQLVLVTLLTTVAAVAALLGAHHAVLSLPLLRHAGARLLAPFVSWMLISVAVHVSIRQKVIGHLVLIAGWVGVVLLSGSADSGGSGAGMPGWTSGGLVAGATVVVFAFWRRAGSRVFAGTRRQASATAEIL